MYRRPLTPRKRLMWNVALALTGLGMLLLAVVGGYLVWAKLAEVRMLNASGQPRPGATPLADDFARLLREQGLLSAIAEAPTPQPTPTPEATVQPTPTAEATPVPPAPTATPVPTATSAPTHTAAPTRTPTPTPLAWDASALQKLKAYLPQTPARPAAELTAFPQPVRLVIPSIELDSQVVEMGNTSDTPAYVVGHYGSTNPGQAGNVVLGGENAAFLKGKGDIFGRLEEVKLGDPLIVYTDNNWYLYVVTGWKVVPQTLEAFTSRVINPTTEPVLTLFTCTPRLVWSHYLVLTATPYQPPS